MKYAVAIWAKAHVLLAIAVSSVVATPSRDALAVPSGSSPSEVSSTPPDTPSAARELTWRLSDCSVALLNQGRMVWEHVHDKKIGKPYMRFGLLHGTELTRPWPVPKGYPKDDHSWHRALWWSWKTINGANFWEGNQTGTEPVQAAVVTRSDGSAKIDLTIVYHLPNKSPVVRENRTVIVTAPDSAGTYLIDWDATFTPTDKDDVRFGQNSYGGFALRMAAQCCGDPDHNIPAWKFAHDQGQTNCNDKPARWVSYQGKLANGQSAGVAVFDHPDNPRHPALWQLRPNYPYMNPSLTCKEDYVLQAGKVLRLRYGVLVSAGPLDTNVVEQRWKTYSGTDSQ